MVNAHALIKAALEADIPVLLWGDPGTGKTATLLSWATEQKVHIETLIGSTLDPSDVCGIPIPDHDHGMVKLAPPEWAVRIKKALDAKQKTWLFLDEISCAAPAVQAALLRVVNERQVGDVSIAGCRVIAAANPPDSAADNGWLSAAATNRWSHINWIPSVDEWVTGEMSGWGEKRTEIHNNISSMICSFVKKSSELFISLPKGTSENAWPSPRSWSFSAKIIAQLGGFKSEFAKQAMSSCIGQGATDQFFTWHKSMDLPDPEDVLSGKAKLPQRADQLYTCLNAATVASLEDRPNKIKRIKKMWKILIDLDRIDAAIIPSKVLLSRQPASMHDEAARFGKRLVDINEKSK